jgi:hypothetical protein
LVLKATALSDVFVDKVANKIAGVGLGGDGLAMIKEA